MTYSEVGAKVREVTGESNVIQSTHRAVAMSNTRTLESMDDVSNQLPLGEKHCARTPHSSNGSGRAGDYVGMRL